MREIEDPRYDNCDCLPCRMSPRKWRRNTYGYARAEVVGALVNSVFLFALCFSIAMESVKRFLLIEKIDKPEMIIIVGGVGLAINVFGMFLFGDVGHGHSHDGGGESLFQENEIKYKKHSPQGTDIVTAIVRRRRQEGRR